VSHESTDIQRHPEIGASGRIWAPLEYSRGDCYAARRCSPALLLGGKRHVCPDWRFESANGNDGAGTGKHTPHNALHCTC
jgi:hypothetical protein